VTPAPAPAPTAAPATSAEAQALAAEKTYWEDVSKSNDPDEVASYLAQYPNGLFVERAKQKLAELKGTTQAAGTEPASGARQSVQPAQSSPAVQSAQIGIIAMPAQKIYASTSGAQVRAMPSTAADVLSKLRTNEEITATGETKDGKWWRV
jgi:hypothetical protein